MSQFTVRLPATSANLGPGFDSLGLAMALFLDIEAHVSSSFSIEAEGRDRQVIASLERNLMLETYRAVAPKAPPLSLGITNGIPLGMGCGSSAAALLAGVLLANQFGELGWSGEQILDEACRREGHPDNVAACFYGGLTASAMQDGRVTAASFGQDLPWRLLLALPKASLATEKARALLPDGYSRADTVFNIQATALLVSAFALGRPELLAVGTGDRVHQPYRSSACPLLPLLLPLAGQPGIYSVTLSGAGPSVLLICDSVTPPDAIRAAIRAAASDESLEILETTVGEGHSIQRENR